MTAAALLPATARHAVRPDGKRLFYRDHDAAAADRPPVLCLPGLTRNSRDFEALAARLASARRVICPDLRGRGRSDYGPTESYSVATEAGDVLALLDGLGIARVVVIGTSRGGLIAMAMAAMRPGLICGAALNDVGPVIDFDALAPIVAMMRATPAGPIDWAAAEAHARRWLSPALPDLSDAAWARVARQMFRDENGRAMRDYDPRLTTATVAAIETARAGGAPDLWPPFAKLAATPVLALRGALSPLLSAGALIRMADAAPTVTAVTVPNRGHAPLLDEPVCLAAIDALLRRIDGETAV